MEEVLDTLGNLATLSMTQECLKDVRLTMAKEIAKKMGKLYILNADQDIMHLAVVYAGLIHLNVLVMGLKIRLK